MIKYLKEIKPRPVSSEDLKHNEAIYPKILCIHASDLLTLGSLVRIYRNEKYYLVPVIQRFDLSKKFLNYKNSQDQFLFKFIEDCYLTLVFHKVSESNFIINDFGVKIELHELDNSQISEEERLNPLKL